ncbi:ATP binding microtubule motor family protein [Perilla frutescens var. hirtella]|nr:ATP binding microtubule motor family protein [Perilla frutescens var. hirtella]
MEMKSPPPCPATVTVRRNPPRRARATPSSAVPLRVPLSSPSLSRDIFATEIEQNPNNADYCKADSASRSISDNLKVFLRIRPLTVQKNSRIIPESKNVWPKNPKIKSKPKPKTKKSCEMCVQENEDLRSVTVLTPQPLQETKRIKSEVYEGFSHVFSAESSQNDVYEEMVKPLVEDFLKGKSGMLAAMGPSGSGKTHTVFGCAREPGMVPLALRRIFSEDESSAARLSRVVYLSMFEICSERGKAEGMIDLLHDGGDVSMQHSVMKGLREAVVCNAQQAESLIARGMLKRATAMTNSNSQSSRSQCIINIRCSFGQGGEEIDGNASDTILTIVDLAGAEREKKTGNQGARLLESNFINNTSMVFGQCLRSLLEHQRNRNKTLQKHYKNSLLTRYLRDYLEGKKRMMLILTVKPGVEDYLDTSFLLRQASPFAKIKFKTVEEPVNLTNKRPNQALPQAGQLKKMKFGNNETSLIDEVKTDRGFPQNLHNGCSEIHGEAVEGCIVKKTYDENVNEIHALSNGISGLGIEEKLSQKGDDSKLKIKKEREYEIMKGLSKELWNVLKQYKEKLEGVQIENCHLRDILNIEKTRTLDLVNELTNEKMRVMDLENEVKVLKSRCTCSKPSSNDFQVSTHCSNVNLSQYEMAESPEVNSDIVSPSFRCLEKTENEKVADPSARDSVATFASCSDGGGEQHLQQLEDLLETSDDTENTEGFRDGSELDLCFRNKVLSTSIDSSRELVCYVDIGIVDIPSTSEEQDAVNTVGDVKNLESESECALDGSCLATSLESESNTSTQDFEDLKDAKQEPTQFQNGMTDNGTSLFEEQNVPMAAQSHADLKSSEYPQNGDTCNHVKEEGMQLEPLATILPKEGLDAENMPTFVPKVDCCTKKPRRRLQPASSVLLKDLNLLDIKDENDKPKGTKVGKRVTADDKSRTQGSLSLLNLLTSKLDR